MYRLMKVEGLLGYIYVDYLGRDGKFYFHMREQKLCFNPEKTVDLLLLDYEKIMKEDNKIVIETKKKNVFTFAKFVK